MIVNCFELTGCKLGQTPLRTEKTAAGNRRLAKTLVQCLNEALCSASSFVLADSFVLQSPPPSPIGKTLAVIVGRPNRQKIKYETDNYLFCIDNFHIDFMQQQNRKNK